MRASAGGLFLFPPCLFSHARLGVPSTESARTLLTMSHRKQPRSGRRFLTLVQIKALLVRAHRAKDWAWAASLSQLKQKIKKKRYCPDCGTRVSAQATRCRPDQRARIRKKRLFPLFLLFCGCSGPPSSTDLAPPHPLVARPTHSYRLEGRILPPPPAPWVSTSGPVNAPAPAQ